jgi:hypothetical protein
VRQGHCQSLKSMLSLGRARCSGNSPSRVA